MSTTPSKRCLGPSGGGDRDQEENFHVAQHIISQLKSNVSSRFDVAVYGAGVFGSWTAWHLARAGRSVVLIDPWGPAHSRASSGGESRIIRMGYGADEIYTRMSMRSLAIWQDLFRRAGQPLFHHTGVLWMARDGDPYTIATRETFERTGVSFEIIRDMAARYPQIRLSDPRAYGILEPDSGVLMARRAVALVVEDAGVTCAKAPQPADVEVYACGPWLPKLFPELLTNRIYPTRQEVFFFAPPAGDSRFGPPHLPAWLDFADPRGPYGVPDLESRGFKLAFDRHGADFDPDTGDRRITRQGVEEARRFSGGAFSRDGRRSPGRIPSLPV